MKNLILIISLVISSSLFAKEGKKIQWKDAPGEHLKQGSKSQGYSGFDTREPKEKSNIVDHKGNVTIEYRQECDNLGNCKTIRDVKFKNRYHRRSKEEISSGQCYIKAFKEKQETHFYKILDRKDDVIFTLVEIISDKTKRHDYKLYKRNFVFNDDVFNSDIESIPCEEAPTIGNNSYVNECTKNGKYKRTFFCNTREFRKRRPASNNY